jgi:hypothetical protein
MVEIILVLVYPNRSVASIASALISEITLENPNKNGRYFYIPESFYDFLVNSAFVNLSMNPSFAAPSLSSL